MNDAEWFAQLRQSEEVDLLKKRPLVYFCAEYALRDDLPLYAGGLGILAGDIVREAASQKLPFVAVGLFYHHGYIHRDIDKAKGVVTLKSPETKPHVFDLTPVVDASGDRIYVSIPLKQSHLLIQAWIMKIGTATIYLLDTAIPQNTADGQHITDALYAGDREVRFMQEMVLGIGGLRLLHALHIDPVGYHLNEGHSALLGLEMMKCEMTKHERSFHEELQNTRKHLCFTNHTLLPGGNDVYDCSLVAHLMSGYATEMRVPMADILALGCTPDSPLFSMTTLALRLSGKINAVSRIHAQKAAKLWSEFPMIAITNGIHLKTWDCIKTVETLYEDHLQNKLRLLAEVKHETGVEWDPSLMVLGWARRIVSYKRPFALFENKQEFIKRATDPIRPFRVLISGLSHASDSEGYAILKEIQHLVTGELKDLVVYLPQYRMSTGRLMTAGCDVWLNTPLVGLEACGTSGMKAALNGVLPCSTPDGWIAEVDLERVGWLLQNDEVSKDILSVLDQKILPLYYSRSPGDLHDPWTRMMYNARALVTNRFSATRMLRTYFEKMYSPIIQDHLLRYL